MRFRFGALNGAPSEIVEHVASRLGAQGEFDAVSTSALSDVSCERVRPSPFCRNQDSERKVFSGCYRPTGEPLLEENALPHDSCSAAYRPDGTSSARQIQLALKLNF